MLEATGETPPQDAKSRPASVQLQTAGDFLKAAHGLLEHGRRDEADALLTLATASFPTHQALAHLFASLASQRRDWPAAVARWQSVRERFPRSPSGYAGGIGALRAVGRMTEAEALLPAAESVLADAGADESLPVLRLRLTVAKMQVDWPTVRHCADAIVRRDATVSAHVFLDLAQAHWNLDSIDLAARAALRAVEIDPTLVEGFIVLAWVATARGDGDAAIDSYRRLAELRPYPPRWSLKLVQLLNWQGRVEEAVREMQQICARWPEAPQVRSALSNFGPGSAMLRETQLSGGASTQISIADTEVFALMRQTAPAESLWKRSLVSVIPESELQIAALAGASAAVLAFTGANDGMSMPLPIFDRYLAALDVTTIYVKDFRRLMYLLGIGSLGDSYAATLAALSARLQRLGITRLATIGNCAGAAAAIRYGVDLGAELILAAGPVSHFPEKPSANSEQGRKFMRTRVGAEVGLANADLKVFLEQRRYGASIEIYCREDNDWEREQAEWLARAAGVRLHALRGDPHHAAMQRLALSEASIHGRLSDWQNMLHAPHGGP